MTRSISRHRRNDQIKRALIGAAYIAGIIATAAVGFLATAALSGF